jgi:hypothetical protein
MADVDATVLTSHSDKENAGWVEEELDSILWIMFTYLSLVADCRQGAFKLTGS